MVLIVPTVEQIEDYLEAIEDLLFSSLSAATPDLPNVRVAVQRLWDDVSRFGPSSLPSLPDIHMPGLGAFEVPPPPPPPPPPRSLVEKSADWVSGHPWKTAGLCMGIVGAGLLVGYGMQPKYGVRERRVRATAISERRQIVVVLGGDTPLGRPLIVDLESKGYIVITSVSTPEAVSEVEAQSHGYVRAIVLDPTEVDTIPYFLRSLTSTMSRRFPITAAGDPHASTSAHVYIHSVISLLTLPPPSTVPLPAPLETLDLQNAYLPYLQATHIAPLQVLQALLPLVRGSPARARDAVANNLPKKSIVVCLPATDARVGLPFASAQAMSAAATLRGVEVLRREIRVAAMTDTSDSMKNIKVVVVDVGAIGVNQTVAESQEDIVRAMDGWTPSEKVAYGNAFASAMGGTAQVGVRKPSDVTAFVRTVVDVVSGGRKRTGGIYDIGLGLGRLREWIRGDRVVVGAGARTYALAANLPSLILDGLLNLPHLLISARNALLPVPPRAALPYPPPVPPTEATVGPAEKAGVAAEKSRASSDQEHQHDANASDTGSEADVESNEGEGVGESWVSLKGKAS